jgi:hypothetical protein
VKEKRRKKRRKTHLIFLVHGLQATQYDMALLKNNMHFLFPEAELVSSCSNEDDTNCSIEDMGQRLADEIKFTISEEFPESQLKRYIR